MLAAESSTARIQVDLAGTIFGGHSGLFQRALSINIPHLLLGQGETLQEGCNGMGWRRFYGKISAYRIFTS